MKIYAGMKSRDENIQKRRDIEFRFLIAKGLVDDLRGSASFRVTAVGSEVGNSP